MSTTNGTRALDRVRQVPLLMTAALPNRDAVARRLLAKQPDSLVIVGSGWEGAYSLEDSLAAGALAARLHELDPKAGEDANDELTAAIALWNQWVHDPEACLRIATHGRRLIGLATTTLIFAVVREWISSMLSHPGRTRCFEGGLSGFKSTSEAFM